MKCAVYFDSKERKPAVGRSVRLPCHVRFRNVKHLQVFLLFLLDDLIYELDSDADSDNSAFRSDIDE